MKRVIVTGASGFIGANLARRLLRDGHDTHLLLRESHQAWRVREIERDAQVHSARLEDADAIGIIVHSIRPEWVFNLAAHGAYSSQTDAARMISTNIAGCVSLLDACAAAGVEAFVQAGSSSEYGYKDHAAREDELIEPNSFYAVTKAAATHHCRFVARQRGVNAITLRFYSIFGPYEERTRLIPTLITHGLRGQLPPLVSPQTARDFVYVDDAVDAMLRVARTAPAHRGAVYNVCTGIQSDLASVVGLARRLMHIEVEPVWGQMPGRNWDTDVWVGSPESMTREVGWQCGTNFETGFARTVDWFKTIPGWLKEIYGIL